MIIHEYVNVHMSSFVIQSLPGTDYMHMQNDFEMWTILNLDRFNTSASVFLMALSNAFYFTLKNTQQIYIFIQFPLCCTSRVPYTCLYQSYQL